MTHRAARLAALRNSLRSAWKLVQGPDVALRTYTAAELVIRLADGTELRLPADVAARYRQSVRRGALPRLPEAARRLELSARLHPPEAEPDAPAGG